MAFQPPQQPKSSSSVPIPTHRETSSSPPTISVSPAKPRSQTNSPRKKRMSYLLEGIFLLLISIYLSHHHKPQSLTPPAEGRLFSWSDVTSCLMRISLTSKG